MRGCHTYIDRYRYRYRHVCTYIVRHVFYLYTCVFPNKRPFHRLRAVEIGAARQCEEALEDCHCAREVYGRMVAQHLLKRVGGWACRKLGSSV